MIDGHLVQKDAPQFIVAGLCGSLRRGSVNEMLLQSVGELAPPSLTLAPVSIDDLPIYKSETEQEGFPEVVIRLLERISAADAVLVATPEHNGSMPAALKNAIDWMSRVRPTPLHNKPCAVVSAASGMLGGSRAQYEFRRSAAFLNALVMVQPEVFVSYAAAKFDTNGRFIDDAGRQSLGQFLVAFTDWIRRMRVAYPRVDQP